MLRREGRNGEQLEPREDDDEVGRGREEGNFLGVTDDASGETASASVFKRTIFYGLGFGWRYWRVSQRKPTNLKSSASQ